MEQHQRIQQLTKEITSVIAQYEAEVGSSHKAWPVAIKKRILNLCELEVGPSKIKELTGIPYMTVLKWRKEAGLPIRQTKRSKKNRFHSISLVSTTAVDQSKTTTVVDAKNVPKTTITITPPEGIKIEFSDQTIALKILKSHRGD